MCFCGSDYTLGFLFLVPLKIHYSRKSNTPKEFPLHHRIWADPPPNPKIGYAKGFVLWGHGSLDEVWHPPFKHQDSLGSSGKGNTLVGESNWVRRPPELPERSNQLRRPSCRVLRLRRTGLPWNPLGDAAKAGAPVPLLSQVVVGNARFDLPNGIGQLPNRWDPEFGYPQWSTIVPCS